MIIPNVVIKNNRKYFFVKEYKDFVRYIDVDTNCMTCFSKYELGLIKEVLTQDTEAGSIGIRKIKYK